MDVPPAVIETDQLTRAFKRLRAVDSLTLSIPHGELFGLVGPDGAGKTTTLRLLAGLLKITEGTAKILGLDLGTQAESIKSHKEGIVPYGIGNSAMHPPWDATHTRTNDPIHIPASPGETHADQILGILARILGCAPLTVLVAD